MLHFLKNKIKDIERLSYRNELILELLIKVRELKPMDAEEPRGYLLGFEGARLAMLDLLGSIDLEDAQKIGKKK